MPGYDVQTLSEDRKQLGANELGAICIKLPLAPGCLPTLWLKDERFIESYLSAFPGYYETADAGFIEEDGYISTMARTTILSTSLDTGFQQAAWRKWCLLTLMSLNAPYWELMTNLKGKYLLDSCKAHKNPAKSWTRLNYRRLSWTALNLNGFLEGSL